MLNKQNFTNLFYDKDEKTNTVIERSIIIPIVQRDYAQGRDDEQATSVRDRFLQALYNAVTDKPITLDFIYGDINKETNVVTLLDGQQRITTLFLLHWYAAKKNNIDKSEYDFLNRFSYETRYSSRLFCSYLIDYNPNLDSTKQLSDDIEDQPWFTLGWKNDPTIKSMLRMIDSIDEKFKNVSDLWNILKTDAITFYFLFIEKMGLTDELYIKMNSRGKPLSEFENFKVEFEGEISKYDENKAHEISAKIDGIWTDLLWPYKDETNTIDNAFLNLFKTVCQIIAYKDNQYFEKNYTDSFELLYKYFDSESPNFENHLQILESCFDNWYRISKEQPLDAFFQSFLSEEHNEGKITISQRQGEIDLFKDCISSSNYTLPKLVLFYAFITYLTNQNQVTEDEFRRRIRTINNLILNSEDEISDLESRASGNRMPAILRQTDNIIVAGVIDTSAGISFNANQLEEETEKLSFTSNHPELAESLFILEDHALLTGQISIVGLEDTSLFEKFTSLFKCDYDKINRALLSIGNYGQKIGYYDIYQYGSANKNSSWRNLFHKSKNNAGFEDTKEVLTNLLKSHTVFSNELLDSISQNYLNRCDKSQAFDWRYYFIKYSSFRIDPTEIAPKFCGKYYQPGFNMYVMVTEKKISENAYDPFIKEATKNIQHGASIVHNYDYYNFLDVMYSYGTGLHYRYNDNKIEIMTIEKNAEDYDEFKKLKEIPIHQNPDLTDAEDRIQKLIDLVNIEITSQEPMITA